MNFAFIVVLVAAVSGLVSELALRTLAPQAGPALSLGIMAVAMIGAAARLGQPKKSPSPSTPPVGAPVKVKVKSANGAEQSLAPV